MAGPIIQPHLQVLVFHYTRFLAKDKTVCYEDRLRISGAERLEFAEFFDEFKTKRGWGHTCVNVELRLEMFFGQRGLGICIECDSNQIYVLSFDFHSGRRRVPAKLLEQLRTALKSV